jgi:nicotinamidase-related amidase
MQALLVIDAQNEFSDSGLRPVPNHAEALRRILVHVNRAREKKQPIAWIQHHNKPHESDAFAPGTWGAEFVAWTRSWGRIRPLQKVARGTCTAHSAQLD